VIFFIGLQVGPSVFKQDLRGRSPVSAHISRPFQPIKNSTLKKIKFFVALGESRGYSTHDIETLPPNRGAINMSQGTLSFKHEEEKLLSLPISFADLPVYINFIKIIVIYNVIAPFASV